MKFNPEGAAPKCPFMEESYPVANPAAGWESYPVANPAISFTTSFRSLCCVYNLIANSLSLVRNRKEKSPKERSESDNSESNDGKKKIAQFKDLSRKRKSRSRDRTSSADSVKREPKNMPTRRQHSSGSSSEGEEKVDSTRKKRDAPRGSKQSKQKNRSSDAGEDSRALEAKKAAIVRQLKEQGKCCVYFRFSLSALFRSKVQELISSVFSPHFLGRYGDDEWLFVQQQTVFSPVILLQKDLNETRKGEILGIFGLFEIFKQL